MIAALIPFALKIGIPERYAKAAVVGVLVILAVAAFFGAKAIYDHSIISGHDAKQEAKAAKADRKADASAGEERRADDTRQAQEQQETKEAVDEARREGRDPRAAYYACVQLQQSARAKGKPPPDC